MSKIKLDLTKLFGFKIIANEKFAKYSVCLNSKIGGKPGIKADKR